MRQTSFETKTECHISNMYRYIYIYIYIIFILRREKRNICGQAEVLEYSAEAKPRPNIPTLKLDHKYSADLFLK